MVLSSHNRGVGIRINPQLRQRDSQARLEWIGNDRQDSIAIGVRHESHRAGIQAGGKLT
jgi:hypothetical protein